MDFKVMNAWRYNSKWFFEHSLLSLKRLSIHSWNQYCLSKQCSTYWDLIWGTCVLFIRFKSIYFWSMNHVGCAIMHRFIIFNESDGWNVYLFYHRTKIKYCFLTWLVRERNSCWRPRFHRLKQTDNRALNN